MRDPTQTDAKHVSAGQESNNERAYELDIWSDRYSVLLSYRNDLTSGTNGGAMREKDLLLTTDQAQDLHHRYVKVREEQATAERVYADKYGQQQADALRSEAIAYLTDYGYETPPTLDEPVPQFNQQAAIAPKSKTRRAGGIL